MKVIVAVTGLAMFLFLISHMIANALVFVGPDALNAYGHGLRQYPAVLWGARLGLLIALLAHVYTTIRLTQANRAARPVPYVRKASRAATVMSQTMIVTGLLLFAYIGYHLAHYTLGWVQPEYLEWTDAAGRHDVYRMTVTGFRHLPTAMLYIVAMVLLGMHVWHGTQSALQSLGYHPAERGWVKKTAIGIAVVVVLGFISVPVAVLGGWVKL
jgi:succinate dehydrogenase / fumarate reductase cytochrome b subunit